MEKEKKPAAGRKLVVKRIIAIVSVVIFVGLMFFAHVYIVQPLIDQLFGGAQTVDPDASLWERLTSGIDPDNLDLTYLSDMYRSSPVKTVLIYIGIQILQVFIALIPGEVVEVSAGILFGPWMGLVYSLIGVAVGSSIVFMFTKLLGIRFVELFVDSEKINNMKIIKNNRRLNGLVFMIFFIPGTPKDLMTYLIGLTRMKLGTFLALSLLARTPSILTSTLAGDALRDKDYKLTVIIFAITGVAAVIGYIVYSIMSKRSESKKAAQSEEQQA
ncbi:MAG: VTT domain-containing protein [Ruminococcaceae bacterium]|nr:VTT domain-containing protein [Oscillospiraceae bacterium]